MDTTATVATVAPDIAQALNDLGASLLLCLGLCALAGLILPFLLARE